MTAREKKVQPPTQPYEADQRGVWARSKRVQNALVGLIVAAIAVRVPLVVGRGYSLDEEITYFAVRGIQEHGVPLFPSGVLDQRGVPFSYLAWLAEQLFGQPFVSYRIVSLIFAVVAICALYGGVTLFVSEEIGLLTCALLVVFPLHIAASAWGRFYSLASASYVSSVLLFYLSSDRPNLRPMFLACLTVAVLSHELGITLVALPIFAFAVAQEDNSKRFYLRLASASLIVSLLARLAVFALTFIAPSQQLNTFRSGSLFEAGLPISSAPIAPVLLARPLTVLCIAAIALAVGAGLAAYRKVPSFVFCVCVALSAVFQLGLVVLFVVIATILRPERARSYLSVGAATGIAAAVFWTVHTSLVTRAAASPHLLKTLSASSLSYPWDPLGVYIRSLPLSFLLIGIGVVATSTMVVLAIERERTRILLALVIVDFAVLGVLNLPARSRYLLVFWPALMVLVGVGIAQSHRYAIHLHRNLGRAIVVALAIGLVTEHALFSFANPLLLTPTSSSRFLERIDPDAWSGPLSLITANAVVVSNDELACVYHVGRIDFWLASDRSDLAQFALTAGGNTYGVYGGGRQLFTLDGVTTPQRGSVTAGRPIVVVLFNTGRFAFAQYREMAMRVANRRDAVVREASGIFVMRVG